MVSALPVWSAYCLPKGDGALDLVWGVSSRDIVSQDVSCVWPRASVVWRSPGGADRTESRAADWRFASPLVVLVAGAGVLVWRRRRAATARAGADSANLSDTRPIPRVMSS